MNPSSNEEYSLANAARSCSTFRRNSRARCVRAFLPSANHDAVSKDFSVERIFVLLPLEGKDDSIVLHNNKRHTKSKKKGIAHREA